MTNAAQTFAPAIAPAAAQAAAAALPSATARRASGDPSHITDVTPALPAEVRLAVSPVGVTADKRMVFTAFLSNADVKAAMEGCGYEWLTLPSDEEGFEISGWVQTRTDVAFPKPPTPIVALIKVKSDTATPGKKPIIYTVGVQTNDNGVWKTVSCTCEAGAQGKPCKHLYRAQAIASGAYAQAREAIMAKTPSLTREGFDALFAARAKEAGTNGAIALVIRAGLGDHHPLARLPLSPATPVNQLKRYVAKQAAQKAQQAPSAE